MSKITWQPWKSKFPPNPALASWKTYKSIFLISGLPKFAHQGCHISVGRKDRISKTIPDIGQKVILKSPVTGIFGAFCLTSWSFCRSVLRQQLFFFKEMDFNFTREEGQSLTDCKRFTLVKRRVPAAGQHFRQIMPQPRQKNYTDGLDSWVVMARIPTENNT